MSLPLIFSKNIYKNDLSIKNSDKIQIDLFKELSDTRKDKKLMEKIYFLENVLNNSKSNVFPLGNPSTLDATPDLRPNQTVDPQVFYRPTR